jgi:hypothetical protein
LTAFTMARAAKAPRTSWLWTLVLFAALCMYTSWMWVLNLQVIIVSEADHLSLMLRDDKHQQTGNEKGLHPLGSNTNSKH